EQLTQDLATRLRETLAVEQLPDWLLQPRQLRVIRAIPALPQAFRCLAWRLLRVRCGAPPWRLADEPANQEFIARLKAFGIDPDPWINPPAAKRYEARNGAALWLAIEQDPLEIFQMGSHFETCLSPGDANFFSVFANAADINKHVVYARDREG